MSSVAEIGALAFFDNSLSSSGSQSCATCHDPKHAYAPADANATQFGGHNLSSQGFRATPSLRYSSKTPPFYLDEKGQAYGGFNRDGKFNTLEDQAVAPLLSPIEMANLDTADLAKKIRRTKYFSKLTNVFGDIIKTDDDAVVNALAKSLAKFQLEDLSFNPYSSRYDLYLEGKLHLNPSETRGMALFNDPEKGNCAACHSSTPQKDGGKPLFTNFGYEALGVPRNQTLSVNEIPSFFDLGLCASQLKDHLHGENYCGMFKIPTLRNAASRHSFFHNGKIPNLRETISFYSHRDTNPARWYGQSQDGRIVKFNDLPKGLRTNVNRDEVPYDRRIGKIPRLSESEIDDLVSFISALTDRDVVLNINN